MKTSILIIGKNEEILTILLRVVNAREGYYADGTGDIERAIELFTSNKYDLVLLSSKISEEEELRIRSVFRILHPEISVIQHYGGGSGLLFNEIEFELSSSKKNITVLDNPFG